MAGERAPRELPQGGPSYLGPTPEWDPAARHGPEHARGLQPPKDDPLTFVTGFVSRVADTEPRFRELLHRVRKLAITTAVEVLQLPREELLERARAVDREAETGRWRHERGMFTPVMENDWAYRYSMTRQGLEDYAGASLGMEKGAMTMDEVADVLLRADLASRLVRRGLMDVYGVDPESLGFDSEFDNSHPEVGKASLLADEAIRAYSIAPKS